MKKIKTYFELFLTFFKIGLFTFGGGYAMISLIMKEFVDNKNWLKKEELMDMIAISESTPGPLAINMATYVGYKTHKIPGAILATLGVILPSFMIIFAIALFLEDLLKYKIVQDAFMGINCAVGVLLLTSGLGLLSSIKKNFVSISLLIVAFVATILILFFNSNFSTIYLMLIGAAISLIVYSIDIAIKKNKGDKK